LNLVASLLVAGGLLYVSFAGVGLLPPLGAAFNPGSGVWRAATEGVPISGRTLRLAGLHGPADVAFDRNGIAHIRADNEEDLFLATGYVHARFRLFQMDLLRRQGGGRLAEVFGPAALPVDEFELELGLLRTARAEWARTPSGSESERVLLAYSKGVNDRIEEATRDRGLPPAFKLLGYQPQPWTPIDSLLIKGDMTQTLDFQEEPLTSALLLKSLGPDRTAQWFPVQALNEQHPYAPGPYKKDAPEPLPVQRTVSDATAAAAAEVLDRLDSLPDWAVHRSSNSNNWAVDGSKSVTGLPLMAGDPHLELTLPAIWYQVDLESPTYTVSGVTIPGTPVVVIGRNRHISWSLTNVQNQATLYYKEETDSGRPDQYLWNGTWRHFDHAVYDIPVKGGGSTRLDVKLSVHGPVITRRSQTMSVAWMGNQPSADLEVLLRIGRASNYGAFRDALRDWHSPSQNFVYTDDAGHIGMIGAGYYPIVRSGDPWLPLPGTGESDIVGTIPFDDIPQVYDPPSHFVFSANQRPVGPDYPYYIGTAFDEFDPGYRANRIYSVLSGPGKFSAGDMQRLQNDNHDQLAIRVLPKLIEALDQTRLTPLQSRAAALLKTWDADMDAIWAAPAIWWTFWWEYRDLTFKPWWDAGRVPVSRSDVSGALDQDLETWTLQDPRNSVFTPPGASPQTALDVMVKAFGAALDTLTRQLGPDIGTWQWGRIHSRTVTSLLRVNQLSWGPRPASGDSRTVNAAGGTSGPSWRLIVDWNSKQALGIYPGGQSENPVSPWYQNLVGVWWRGEYLPLLSGDEARAAGGSVSWNFQR
jgi:penicillin amidase